MTPMAARRRKEVEDGLRMRRMVESRDAHSEDVEDHLAERGLTARIAGGDITLREVREAIEEVGAVLVLSASFPDGCRIELPGTRSVVESTPSEPTALLS